MNFPLFQILESPRQLQGRILDIQVSNIFKNGARLLQGSTISNFLISYQIHLPKDIYYVPVHSTLQNHVLEHPMVHIRDIFVSKMNKNHNTDTCISQNGTKMPKLAKVTYSLSMVHPSGIQICLLCTLWGPKLGYKWCPLNMGH